VRNTGNGSITRSRVLLPNKRKEHKTKKNLGFATANAPEKRESVKAIGCPVLWNRGEAEELDHSPGEVGGKHVNRQENRGGNTGLPQLQVTVLKGSVLAELQGSTPLDEKKGGSFTKRKGSGEGR